jgi:hypothetical protein
MADIDLSGYDGKDGRPSFNLIGGEFTWNGSRYAGNGFTGVFDGNGHVISNFTYESPGTNCVALFRGVEGGQLLNLGLINPSIQGGDLTSTLVAVIGIDANLANCWVEGGSVTGSDMVGGLAAYTQYDVTIADSYASIAVSGSQEVGGFIGFNNYDCYTARCYATGNVNGYETVGGFVGINHVSVIEQCYAKGEVVASYRDVGGFAGSMADDAKISNCYARVDVTGYDYVGNFLGRNTSYTSDIIRCYATGYINGTGGTWVHGMVGRYYPDCYIIEYNFFDTQTSGTTDGCAAFGKTTAQMYQQSTYTAGGWDFETPMWTIDEGADYPKLWWETYYFSDSYGGGTGRPLDPFLIYDANQMNTIGANLNDWDKHFKLMADIDLGSYTGTTFNIIGRQAKPFSGVFDGSGHIIYNFTRIAAVEDDVGLFGYVDADSAQIKDLGLTGVEINVADGFIAGTLVGELKKGTVKGCWADGWIIGEWIVGGLVGENSGGYILDSSADTQVEAYNWAGGLVGYVSSNATVARCFASGDVQATQQDVGGLVGENYGIISDSYAMGNAQGDSQVGGLIGDHAGDVTRCYSTGQAFGNYSVGGLIGQNALGNVTGCFWDTETSKLTYSPGGTGKTTAQMKTAATFLAAGWDFNFEDDNGNDDIWMIEEHLDYPKLCSILGIKYGGGTGESNDPYLIYTAAQMVKIGANIGDWGKSFKLMSDISLADYSGSSYNIIGRSSSPYQGDGPFMGVFDGNYHSISGFSFSQSDISYVGIFGYVGGGIIKNLKVVSPNLTDAYLDDMSYVGPIAGCVDDGDIVGCSVIGGTVEGGMYVGGLVGLCKASFIADCSSSASVLGTSSVGGLVGVGSTFAGIPGIRDSYAQGAVSGNDYVGGFIGDSSDVVIVNCYSTGLVSGTTNVGGFSGYNVNRFPIEDNEIGCFWDVESSGEPNSAVGNPLTTAQMYDENTFINAGWDFVGETANGGSDDWAMPTGGGYPILWHELPVPPALPTFAGGSGSAGDPYLIETEAQLNSIGHNPRLMDKHFRVISDLDLNGMKYYMIANRPCVFSGTFDGAGHTISNILLEPVLDTSDVGFIGSLKGTGASIQNLILAEPNIISTWGWGVGSLTGINESGTITNCHAVNAHVLGLLGVGGLVGINYSYGSISGCSATGDVSENTFMSIIGGPVGGLVGENTFWSEIVNSYAKCNVSGDDCVGGLVGINVVYSILTNCYSQAFVKGTEDYIGGFIGRNRSRTEANYCYSSSVVTGPSGTDSVGGFVGKMGTSGREYYTACFWDSEINPALPGIGNGADPNVVGESTANMQTATTFTDVGWDFIGETVNGPNDIWDICEGTNYPKLVWQIPTGDFVCPDGVNFFDFSFFSERWTEDNCGASNDCEGRDLDLLGSVDINDLRIFADNWLAGL